MTSSAFLHIPAFYNEPIRAEIAPHMSALCHCATMKILIVEDEEKLALALKRSLEREGYTVDHLVDGFQAHQRLSLHRDMYDLVILDIMLTGMTGIEVCREIRKLNITVPVLILTARDITEERVEMLSTCADDYVTKPFEFEEILARIKALLRRPVQAIPSTIKVGELEINTNERQVYLRGASLFLTAKEFALLEYLARHPNQVLDRDTLLEHLWGFEFSSFSNVLDVHVKNLRKKLKEQQDMTQSIETVRGIGYRFNID